MQRSLRAILQQYSEISILVAGVEPVDLAQQRRPDQHGRAQFLSLRVLEQGGVLRLVVPDLQTIVREYLGEKPFQEPPNGAEHLRPADQLNKRLLMRAQSPPSGNLFSRLYSSWMDFHSHKWMYDADSLIHHLESAGFAEVRQMDLYRSRISGIEQVEDPSRVQHGEGICVEGVKQRAEPSESIR